jgi:TPR repeat protein
MRMMVEGRQAFANEPVPLGVSIIGTPNGEFALLSGLAAGTKLSVGTALSDTSWRLAARDLSTAVAHAPKDYIGVMNAAIDLRTSNDAIIDRNVVRLEWVDKQTDSRPTGSNIDRRAALQPDMTGQSIGKDEFETLLRRGAEYMKGGDIAAARLVLRRAASSGNPDAALALGAAYDPYVFGELGVLGFAADAVEARFWYEQAGKFGAREAPQRLDRLMKLGR